MNIKGHITRQNGSAMLVVIAVLMLSTIIGLQMFSVTNDDMTISFNRQGATKAFYAAESGQAIAKSVLWADYVSIAMTNPPKVADEVGDRATYIQFLTNLGLDDGMTIPITSRIDLGHGDYVEAISVTRKDEGTDIVMTVSTTGHALDNTSQTIEASYTVAGAPFRGFEFAILANNINCIMCHATIDNVDRVYNSDTSLVGTFARVKVAALESLLLRTTSADSKIAGTLYTRGNVTDKAGVPITDLSPTGQGLEGFAISSLDGHIMEPMSTVSLVNTPGSPPDINGNLYLNYPIDPLMMTDGNLPETFPPPFPDDNGNRIVDQAEFDQIANNANGTISGGVLYGVPPGGTYSSGFLPPVGNMPSVTNNFTGNLILVGTDANPIIINRDVTIDGDVLIQGVIKGAGQIYARGNIYVTGDLTYNDDFSGGNRAFGTADDGTTNALSLAAGQNVLVGDYLTPKKGDILNSSVIDPGNLSGGEEFSFAMSEMTLFNRAEWTRTQKTLPDISGFQQPNPLYDPFYKPRYYVMNEGDPVYVYNKSTVSGKGKVNGTYFDPVSKTWQGKEHESKYNMSVLSKYDPGDAQLSGATIIPLSSTSNWISPQTLKKLWINDEAARALGAEFKIDGQVYTNNSIFTLSRMASKTQGRMTVNGALVASDLGVLVGNGLNLNYDQRLKTYLKVKDDSKMVMVRGSWYAK